MEKSPISSDTSTTPTSGVATKSQISNESENSPSPKRVHRTPGLKIFDVALYPILTNGVVFAVSVAATYLTTHGDKTGGKIGKWFFERGNKLKNFLMKSGMGEKQADASKMIAFSFLDGSVMAPVVKVIEDKRENIAHWIDRKLGSEPENHDAYVAEPKQSWGSVLGGRVIALAAVLPAGIMLGKIGTKDGKWIWNTTKNNPGFNSLNDHFFTNPGHALGKYIETQPGLAKSFGKLDIPQITSISLFEMFYTSLCTGALYVSSRFIARKRGDHLEDAPEKPAEAPPPAPAEIEKESTKLSAACKPCLSKPPASHRDKYLAEPKEASTYAHL